MRTFEGQIHHRPAMHASPTILPAQRNMHCQVGHHKRFSGLGLPPENRDADTWDETLDEIRPLRADRQIFERFKLEKELRFELRNSVAHPSPPSFLRFLCCG